MGRENNKEARILELEHKYRDTLNALDILTDVVQNQTKLLNTLIALQNAFIKELKDKNVTEDSLIKSYLHERMKRLKEVEQAARQTP